MLRLRQLSRIAFGLHIALGLVVVVGLLVSPPLVIGPARLRDVVEHVEEFDWRWLLIGPASFVWIMPVIAVLAFLQARKAGLEVERVRELVSTLLQNRQIPILVDVDTKVPVLVAAPLRMPIELNTRMSVDETIDIETEVPIRTTLPLDTYVETSVFGIGSVKIPIRAQIPIDLVLPIIGKIRVRSAGLPVHIKDEVVVQLPEFEVPIRSRIETRIDLLDTLRAAEERLRK
jgi:hypothetical protein